MPGNIGLRANTCEGKREREGGRRAPNIHEKELYMDKQHTLQRIGLHTEKHPRRRAFTQLSHA